VRVCVKGCALLRPRAWAIRQAPSGKQSRSRCLFLNLGAPVGRFGAFAVAALLALLQDDAYALPVHADGGRSVPIAPAGLPGRPGGRTLRLDKGGANYNGILKRD
jgi:hypothetical protein